jgi:hypothetical protein
VDEQYTVIYHYVDDFGVVTRESLVCSSLIKAIGFLYHISHLCDKTKKLYIFRRKDKLRVIGGTVDECTQWFNNEFPTLSGIYMDELR